MPRRQKPRYRAFLLSMWKNWSAEDISDALEEVAEPAVLMALVLALSEKPQLPPEVGPAEEERPGVGEFCTACLSNPAEIIREDAALCPTCAEQADAIRLLDDSLAKKAARIEDAVPDEQGGREE